MNLCVATKMNGLYRVEASTVHCEDREIERVKKTYLQQLLKAIEADEVDRLLVPVLRKLNELPGVVTQYSCQGHKTHGSPAAYVYLILSIRKETILQIHTLEFLKSAPFSLHLEFEHSLDSPIRSQLCTRVKISGDTYHYGEDCLPMYHYIHDFLATIGSDTKLDLTSVEK